MAFCTKCGSQLQEGAKFCSVCGSSVSQPSNNGADFRQPNYNQQNYNQPNYNYGGQNYNSDYAETAPIPEANSIPDPNDAAINKVYGVLSYLGLLVLIPLLSQKAKASPFARFHANQGMYFLIINGILSIALNVITELTDSLLMAIISGLFGTFILVIEIIGIVNAAQGTLKPLPIINDIINSFKK